jgi:hypothetical protein
MFGVENEGLSIQSWVEELECIVWVGVGWFVVDIVGCNSSLFEGMECGDYGVGLRWNKLCVVVWSGCVGKFVELRMMVGYVVVGVMLFVGLKKLHVGGDHSKTVLEQRA